MISAALLFTEADRDSLINFSQQINQQTSSPIKLDEHSLPHITVAQFIAPDEASEQLWKNIKHLKGVVNEVLSGGLNFAPSLQHNQMWVELQFLKSDILLELHNEVIKSDFATNFKVHSGQGDNYRPHCTLALLEGQAIPSLKFASLEIFKRTFTGLELAVGINGENFTFVEPKLL